MKVINTKTDTKSQLDWWDKIGEEQQKAIDKVIAEMKAGKLTLHDEVMKKYKKNVGA